MKLKRSSGFTLVEVLVVISITAMIAVIVLQMLTVLFRGYDQIGRIQGDVSVDAMRYGWFRDSLGVMVASLDEEFSFQGSANGMTGFTAGPLIGRQGEIAKVSWEVRSNLRGASLWYSEWGQEPMKIGEWPDTNLQFAYRGQRSGWRDDWPPEDLPDGMLPHRVKLTFDGDEQQREVYAAINVRRIGRYDYRDFLD